MTSHDPASFRDPAGHVFMEDGQVFRTIMPQVKADFDFVHQSGLLQQLILDKKLLDYNIASEREKNHRAPEAAYLLNHPTLDFISYAYEWSFTMLQQAALLQLDIHLLALKKNITLIDATPFNIQFIDNRAYFIDHLSFRPYKEGDIWWGYQQFCQQFLNPLLLQAYCGVNFQAWLRGNINGISLLELNQLLPWHRKFCWKVFFHIFLQAKLQKKSSQSSKSKAKSVHLPKNTLINLLQSMRSWVKNLKAHYQKIYEWQDYDVLHLYSKAGLTLKQQCVAEFCQSLQPSYLWDLGCNTGQYANIALESGSKHIIGFDVDPASIDKAFVFSKKHDLAFLPLVMDFANPTPSLGWSLAERKSLAQRSNAHAVIALAIIHHLRIQNNIPLAQIIHYIVKLAPAGIIEFVPKSDPKVQLLLRYREDIFDDYSFENFLALISTVAHIKKQLSIPDTDRVLIWYQTNET